ncbi:GlcG/HbpS family heme-binding protein [Clostridium thailandense]|uniref:GlcG/HbpS family heme-binding protein n=1 Tax=Clostridium thailandense TaxID=2794346 RepID=UPI0039897D62
MEKDTMSPITEAKNTKIKVARSIMNLALAKEITAAAEAKAKEIKVPMYITIDDADANLISINRMAGVILASEKISQGKAYTAVALKMPTSRLSELSQPGAPLYGIHNNSNIIIFGGGFPLILNGEVIGSIGVSGGSVEEDMSVAEAGLIKFKEIVEELKEDAAIIPSEDLKITGEKITDYGVNLELARKMAIAVEKKAVEIGVPMWFSVVDKGANLILEQRMEEALLISREISLNKAYTAATLKLSTDIVATVAQPGTSLYGIQDVPRMIVFGGGYPLVYNGKTIGGVGVSGGSVEEDMIVCKAALEVYNSELNK